MNKATRKLLATETIRKKSRYELSAKVTPGFGANLVSFKADGREFVHWDEAGLVTGKTFTGAFNMFPTPCRLDKCSYSFEGKRIVQRKNGEEVFIHGLVRDEVMEFENRGDSITSRIVIEPGHPVYEGFPYSCVFSVTHSLHQSGLEIGFRLENRDTKNIPFGYGIHPFWRIHGRRKDAWVRVPCDCTLDLDDLVPTGGVTKVAGTALDIRRKTSLGGFFVDNVFWKRKAGARAELGFDSIGKSIVFEASDNFPHMIVYAPEGEPFVCVENLTTCPNAPNLVTAGYGRVANMLVARPGRAVEGWVRYTLKECFGLNNDKTDE